MHVFKYHDSVKATIDDPSAEFVSNEKATEGSLKVG